MKLILFKWVVQPPTIESLGDVFFSLLEGEVLDVFFKLKPSWMHPNERPEKKNGPWFKVYI